MILDTSVILKWFRQEKDITFYDAFYIALAKQLGFQYNSLLEMNVLSRPLTEIF